MHPISGSEAQHGQWHHMWAHPAVTMSWWIQDLCPAGYKAMVTAAISAHFSACKAWQWPGDRFLSGSPSYKSALLHENTDVSNMWLLRSKILLVNPFILVQMWPRSKLHSKFHSTASWSSEEKVSASGWQFYVLLLLKGKLMKIYISFLFEKL